jgi:DNA-binding NtrC family response regulator
LAPLRQRLDDIPLLAAHFLRKHCERMKREQPRLDERVVDAFNNYHWPGNVRELENAVQRALALTPGDVVHTSALPKRVAAATATTIVGVESTTPDAGIEWAHDLPLPEARKLLQERFERAYLERLLRESGGNMSEAARQSGVDRSNLRRLLNRYGLNASELAGDS